MAPPMIDVSEVVTDPTFTSTFDVVRRPEVTNLFGETTAPSVQTFRNVRGVVSPATPADLQQMPEVSLQSRAFSIVTLFHLQGVTTKGLGDVVIWKGDQFTVVSVEPWFFGAGYFRALISSVDTKDLPQ